MQPNAEVCDVSFWLSLCTKSQYWRKVNRGRQPQLPAYPIALSPGNSLFSSEGLGLISGFCFPSPEAFPHLGTPIALERKGEPTECLLLPENNYPAGTPGSSRQDELSSQCKALTV